MSVNSETSQSVDSFSSSISSLTLIATPIGDKNDISLRALSLLKEAEVVIGEEFKELSKLLKLNQIERKEMHVINEHSTQEDINEIFEKCKNKKAVLVSDCGTPGFCDPGFQLVKIFRKNKLKVTSAPGASSIMTLLSLSSERIYEFYFKGFLPAETEARNKELKLLSQNLNPFIIMDTPYRLQKTLNDLLTYFAKRTFLLGINLTQDTEFIVEGTPNLIIKELAEKNIQKAEFIILAYKN